MKCMLIVSFMLIGLLPSTGQGLQQANSVKVITKNSDDLNFVQTTPKKIDTINLKFDTTNIFNLGYLGSRDKEFKVRDSLNGIRDRLNVYSKEVIGLIDKINRLNKSKKSKAKANELTQANARIKSLEDSIRNYSNYDSLLRLAIDRAQIQVSEQSSLKQEYRREYYDKLLSEAKKNVQILKENYSEYLSELKLKEDSLSPSKWPLFTENKDSMVRQMAVIYTQLFADTKAIEKDLEILGSDYPQIEDLQKEFAELEVLFKFSSQSERFLDSIFSKRKISLSSAFDREKLHNDQFKKKYEEYRLKFQENLSKINAISAKFKPEEKKQSSDATVLANFTQPLNQSSSLVPSIDVFAYNKINIDEDVSLYGQMKLFLAAPGSDTNTIGHATKFFIPEASQFGFMADFNFGFISAAKNKRDSDKKLGLNLSFYYLQKQLATKEKDKTLFPIGLLQLRTGMEFILIKNMLSIYGNINGIYVGKGLEDYNKYYITDKGMKWYTDFGLRSYLMLQSDAQIRLLLDLRFLPVNPAIQETSGTKDKFIPLFKLGIAKAFDF